MALAQQTRKQCQKGGTKEHQQNGSVRGRNGLSETVSSKTRVGEKITVTPQHLQVATIDFMSNCI